MSTTINLSKNCFRNNIYKKIEIRVFQFLFSYCKNISTLFINVFCLINCDGFYQIRKYNNIFEAEILFEIK